MAATADYYQLLGIPNNADSDEIKRAYRKGVRAHPPERDPEGFKRIREAYDTIIDSASRASYDASSDPAVAELLEIARVAMDDEDYERAAHALKKALLFKPNLHFARNLLGLCYLYERQADAAVKLYEHLLSRGAEHPVWLSNQAAAYKMLEKYDLAERNLRRAIQLDGPQSPYYNDLADVYFRESRFEDAIDVLREAISDDGKVDFQDFAYFLKLLEAQVLAKDYDGLDKTLNTIARMHIDESERGFAGWKISTFAVKLLQYGAFDAAARIAAGALRLDINEHTTRLQTITSKARAAKTELDRLSDDQTFRPWWDVSALHLIKSYCGAFDDEDEEEVEWQKIIERLRTDVDLMLFGRTMASESAEFSLQYRTLYSLYPPDLIKWVAEAGRFPSILLVKCPQCGGNVRGARQTGIFGCPHCNCSMSVDSTTGTASKHSATTSLVEDGTVWVGKFILWIIILSVIGGVLENC